MPICDENILFLEDPVIISLWVIFTYNILHNILVHH